MKGLALLLSLCFCNGAFASEALFRAIDDHRERAALELLAGGKAALEARNPKGDTPLHRSVETGLRQLTKALLDAGADPGARTRNGETALHLAALHTEPDFTDLLLAARADPGTRNADGDTPLHWAGHHEVVRLLERFGK
jgi:ankyrin repeat protein